MITLLTIGAKYYILIDTLVFNKRFTSIQISQLKDNFSLSYKQEVSISKFNS